MQILNMNVMILILYKLAADVYPLTLIETNHSINRRWYNRSPKFAEAGRSRDPRTQGSN